MHHVAILRKANISKGDNLLGDIIAGTKTIESRWYVNKIAPWDKILAGDTVYFKGSGCLVTAKAHAIKVLQYDNLNTIKITEIITKYGNQIAPNTSQKDWHLWAKMQKKKRYCILIFLKNVQKVIPFQIDKIGYGIFSAWLVTDDIEKLKC